jgi:FAD/FMN-containing dehydrogenase
MHVDELKRRLGSRLVQPGDADYERARSVWNPAFQETPLNIAYCSDEEDVRICLAFAVSNKIPFRIRAGGHSTGGFSIGPGLVIDVSKINFVEIDGGEARIGAGTNFSHLNSILDTHGLHTPTGTCGDVCVAGFYLGGGYGLTSRTFGLGCDNVLSMKVMLADGRTVRASAEVNPDLFWALRGGTGGNFGVLLELTVRVLPLSFVVGLSVAWSLDRTPAALEVLQRDFMRDSRCDRLGYVGLLCGQAGRPIFQIRGVYSGTQTQAREALKPLVEEVPPLLNDELCWERVGSYRELNDLLHHTPYPIPEVPDGASQDKQSVFIDQPFDGDRLVEFYQASPNPYALAILEPYGGAVSQVGPDDCAFRHREVDFDLALDVFWTNDAEEGPARRHLDRVVESLAPLTNGYSYQNYPRRGLSDYRWRYWGDNFPTLLAIKKKFDPDEIFKFPQGISEAEGMPVGPLKIEVPESVTYD